MGTDGGLRGSHLCGGLLHRLIAEKQTTPHLDRGQAAHARQPCSVARALERGARPPDVEIACSSARGCSSLAAPASSTVLSRSRSWPPANACRNAASENATSDPPVWRRWRPARPRGRRRRPWHSWAATGRGVGPVAAARRSIDARVDRAWRCDGLARPGRGAPPAPPCSQCRPQHGLPFGDDRKRRVDPFGRQVADRVRQVVVEDGLAGARSRRRRS